jgi:recombination protein RecA
VRLEIRKLTGVKEGEETVGSRVKVKVVKNKIAPPFRNAEFDLMFDKGISWEGDLLDLGLEDKLVEKSGAYFTLGESRVQGREKAKEFLRENPAVVEDLRLKILSKRGLLRTAAAEPEAPGEEEAETPSPRRGKQAAAE